VPGDSESSISVIVFDDISSLYARAAATTPACAPIPALLRTPCWIPIVMLQAPLTCRRVRSSGR